MMKITTAKGWVLLLLLTMLPTASLATSDEETIAALQARIDTLEAQIRALTEEDASGEDEESDADAAQAGDALPLGAPILLGEGRAFTVADYAIGTRFRYSPAGGISSLSISAKPGYSLLCLYVRVENNTGEDLYTSQLLDATLKCGASYTGQAQESFFYKTVRGVYAGSLKLIGAGMTVDGCLLFALPEDAETSQDKLSVRFSLANGCYEVLLREAGTPLSTAALEHSAAF